MSPTGEVSIARSVQRKVSVDQLRQGRVYGPVGVLESDGDHVRCHICGEWFVSLGSHIWQAHGCRAREYKVAFGLMQSTPLKADSLIEILRKHALESEIGKRGTIVLSARRKKGITSGPRRVPQSDQERPIRQQSHVKIAATKRARNLRNGTRIVHICPQCGDTFEDQRGRKRLYCSPSCSAKAAGLGTHANWLGRTHTEESKIRMSLARSGPTVTKICPGCHTKFTRPTHREADYCSRRCLSEHAKIRHPHGTIRRYRHGCRCDLCRAANAHYHAERRKAGKK